MLAAILSKVSKLITDYTTTRAGYLDKLNITGSKVADGGDYTSTRAAKLDNLDAAISGRAPSSSAVSNADYTSARSAKLDSLDALVSSRSPDKGQKVMHAYLTTSSSSYVTLLNVSGIGNLLSLGVSWGNSSSGPLIGVTIDGQASTGIIVSFWQTKVSTSSVSAVIPVGSRFKTSCLVEVAVSNLASNVNFGVLYSLDI